MLVRSLIHFRSPKGADRIRRLVGGPGLLATVVPLDESLWESVAAAPFDLILAEREALPDPIGETVENVRVSLGGPDLIVLSSAEDAEDQARLLAGGCVAVLSLELEDDALRDSLEALIERRRESSQLRSMGAEEERRLGDFVSSSAAMRELLGVARRVATSDTTLLLLGETGVGKEWLARAVHSEGPRAGGPFVAVNCGAIPEGLLESELFGHRKGSFTGAVSDRRGHFEMAHGGTLFLDEVGEMPPHVQVKLLRVLQERAIQPVGGERTIEVDVRVMAATNRDPAEEIERGRLRRDLYYRLAVVSLSVPPLRDRREDIPELVANYFEIFRSRLGRDVFGISPSAMKALAAYDWPGNVRELINVMERAILLCRGEDIERADLPEAISGAASLAFAAGDPEARVGTELLKRPLREARRQVTTAFDRTYLSALLRETGGRIGETAWRAGMSPRALFERMRQLGLRKEDFRPAGAPAEAEPERPIRNPDFR